MDPERNQEKEMKCIQETYKRWKVRQAISVSNGLSSHLLTDRLLIQGMNSQAISFHSFITVPKLLSRDNSSVMKD